MLVVAKIGSSSVTGPDGAVDESAIGKLCNEIAGLEPGHRLVLVSSGAIAAGLRPSGFTGARPTDLPTLQAVASVGQPRLMQVYIRALERHGLLAGQVLLAPLDFSDRRQYLQARQTIARLLDLGVVPVVNENDATADDEIRFGDNDRLAALVAHMVGADVLVLLTDIAGVFTADPRLNTQASLVEEVTEIDQRLEAAVGGPGSEAGSGGMVSKLAAAKIAAWSGIRTVIADARRVDVVAGALRGEPGIGTVVLPRERRLSSRQLWLAFAVAPAGSVVVDAGARRALEGRGTSLLPAGVLEPRGDFPEGSVVEVATSDGAVFAKGIARHSSATLATIAGRRTSELEEDLPHEVIHRDDMVLLAV